MAISNFKIDCIVILSKTKERKIGRTAGHRIGSYCLCLIQRKRNDKKEQSMNSELTPPPIPPLFSPFYSILFFRFQGGA